MQLKEQEAPLKPEGGHGEVAITKANTVLLQQQLSELAPQIIHTIEACNDKKKVLEEQFDSVKNAIIIMESRLQTEKVRIDSKILGVGTMPQVQDTVLQKLR